MGDIKSTVAEYFGNGDAGNIFVQSESKSPVYVSKVCLNGTDENKKGLIAFDEDIFFTVTLKKKEGFTIDRQALLRATDIVADELYATKVTNTAGVSILEVTVNP